MNEIAATENMGNEKFCIRTKRKNDLLSILFYVTIMCKPESLNLYDQIKRNPISK